MAKRYAERFVPALEPTIKCLKKPTQSDLEFRSRIDLMNSRLREQELMYRDLQVDLFRSMCRLMREERRRNRLWNRLLRWIRGVFGARQ